MSADLNTTIKIKGTPEELLSMLKVIKIFENDNAKQYHKNHDCAYIDFVSVKSSSKELKLKDLNDDDIIKFISESGDELKIDAQGPWGSFFEPGEAELFETLAEAAPNAHFIGDIFGFVTGADVSHNGELKDGKLYLSNYLVANETFPELYQADFEKKLPHAKFCILFKIDENEFNSEYYCEFISDACEEGFPTTIDYQTFIELCDSSEIDAKEFKNSIKKVIELGITDYETFCDTINEDDFTTKSIYDPIKKTYESVE